MTPKRELIISLTPGLNETVERAQRQATAHRTPYGVWEHVGLYGLESGDIPAKHIFMTRPLSNPDPEPVWAMVACVDPA